MTAPSYTEDLSDVTLAEEAAGWVELTGTDGSGNVYSTMGTPAYQDNEYPYIQGSFAVTQDTTKSTNCGSIAFSSGGITVPTDGAVLVWQNYSSPFAFGTYAQGGYRICIGSGLADFKVWYVGGSDKGRMPYGGWENHAVNPTITADDTAGTPTSTLDYIASAVYVVSGPSKGEPHQVDAIRYGRCSAIFEYGDLTNGYCTVAGFATQNDNQSNRWGLIQSIPYGYLWKGRWQLGTTTNAVDFRDSNRNIYVDWTPKVTANFNLIEIINDSSNVEMTGFNFTCLDTASASTGRFLMTDQADVSLDSCTFTDMDTFVFSYDGTNTVTIDTCIFRRCGIITQGGASFTSSTITGSSETHAMLSNNPSAITYCDFISGGSGHAVRCDTIGTYNWTGNTDSGYTGTRGSNLTSSSGSTDAMFYNNSGGLITLNVAAGGQQPSVRNGAGATTQVNANISITYNGLVNGSEVRVYNTGTSTQIDGVESVTGNAFSWTVGSGVGMDIVILGPIPTPGPGAIAYVPIREVNVSFTTDTTVTKTQIVDRNYKDLS